MMNLFQSIYKLQCDKSLSFLCRHALVLFTGVACLDLFIQCNWTGPMPSLASVMTNSEQECSNQQIIAKLSRDGEVQ